MTLRQREEQLCQAGRQVQQLSGESKLQTQQLEDAQAALQQVIRCVDTAGRDCSLWSDHSFCHP